MDNVTINSLAISSLRANRDASNSNVTVSRSIGNLLIGGDVTSTNVNVGEYQSLFADVAFPGDAITDQPPFGAFYGDPPPIIINHQTNPISGLVEPFAQSGGTMQRESPETSPIQSSRPRFERLSRSARRSTASR